MVEDYLKQLFNQLDETERRQNILKGRIKAVGRLYSKKQGYSVPLRMETLRAEVFQKRKEDYGE